MNEIDELAAQETVEMRVALEEMLCDHFGRQVRVAHCDRRSFAYQTSSTINSFDVELAEGTRLELLLKDLSRSGLQPAALRAKPGFLHQPLREIEVYRQILADGRLGTAHYYGSVVDAGSDRYWLLLERVGGRGLYQIGERPLWHAAARWLAHLHCHWANRVAEVWRRAPLLSYDRDFFRLWLARATEFQAEKTQHRPIGWRRLVDGYDRVIDRLIALPKTFIHGEFYASNVLIDDARERVRVCAVDWEMAAVGPGLMDLAALSAGKWSDEERTVLLDAYRAELAEQSGNSQSLADLQRDLDFCRLHVAVQWLGWSRDWSPPARHAHDWLGEVVQLAEKIGL